MRVLTLLTVALAGCGSTPPEPRWFGHLGALKTPAGEAAVESIRERLKADDAAKVRVRHAEAGENARATAVRLLDEMNRIGAALHTVRLSVLVGGETERDLAERLEVVRGASGLDLLGAEAEAQWAGLTAAHPPLQLGGRTIRLDQPQVMGILNVTPDSFSDGAACPAAPDFPRARSASCGESAEAAVAARRAARGTPASQSPCAGRSSARRTSNTLPACIR